MPQRQVSMNEIRIDKLAFTFKKKQYVTTTYFFTTYFKKLEEE